MAEIELLARARKHADRIAFQMKASGRSYDELLERSALLASALLDDAVDLNEARIAFLAPTGFDYTAIQWAIWQAGGVAVPLCLSATEPELEYALSDSQSTCVVASRDLAPKIASLYERYPLRFVVIDDVSEVNRKPLPAVELSRRAMILYTSGTTSKPKRGRHHSRQHSGADQNARRGMGMAVQ